MDYISIIPVKFDNYIEFPFLFKGKAWTPIRKGDIVEVESKGKRRFGEVMSDPISLKPDDEKYKFIMEITNTKEPLSRVTGKFMPITYEEGEE